MLDTLFKERYVNTVHYYMALSHKDWELPNSGIWLAESDIDRHLDRKSFEVKKLQTKMQNHWLFSSNNIYFCKWKKADEKKK